MTITTGIISASIREVPWMEVSTKVDGLMTADEALRAGQLDWDVVKRQAYSATLEPMIVDGEPVEVPTYHEVPGQYGVHRDTDGRHYGWVGEGWTPVQNRDAFGFFDAVVDDGAAKYESAGSIEHGRKVFLTAKLPDTMLIGGVDPVDMYLIMMNGHGGAMSFSAFATPVRLRCTNMLNLAMRSAKQTWRIRHTSKIEGRVAQARESLGLTWKYAETFQAQADAMINQAFTDRQFEAMVKDLFPASKDEDADASDLDAKWSKTQAGMINLFRASDTIDDAFRNTRWGALQAVGEWMDWGRPVRGRTPQAIAEQRTKQTLLGHGARSRDAAMAYLTTV